MNFTKTYHLALSAVTSSTRRLGSPKRSPAEDMFLSTAQDRLEESARMLTAMRLAVLAKNTTKTAGPSTKPVQPVRLSLHRVSHDAAPRAASQRTPTQSQKPQDVINAA
jgi:hypothetical protein